VNQSVGPNPALDRLPFCSFGVMHRCRSCGFGQL
jgi:hypothetical protein